MGLWPIQIWLLKTLSVGTHRGQLPLSRHTSRVTAVLGRHTAEWQEKKRGVTIRYPSILIWVYYHGLQEWGRHSCITANKKEGRGSNKESRPFLNIPSLLQTFDGSKSLGGIQFAFVVVCFQLHHTNAASIPCLLNTATIHSKHLH